MTYEDWYLNKYNIHLLSEIYNHYGTQDYNAIGNVIYINESTIAKPEYENVASDYHRLNRTTSSEELVEKIMNVTMSGWKCELEKFMKNSFLSGNLLSAGNSVV